MASTLSPQVYVGSFVQVSSLGKGLEIFRDYVLLVDARGVIQDFTSRASPAGAHILDTALEGTVVHAPAGSFFLPTFCDLHLHAPQYLYLGTGLHLPLMEWLDAYAYRAEERLDADPRGLGFQVYSRLASRLIEAGTGATLLFGTINEETK